MTMGARSLWAVASAALCAAVAAGFVPVDGASASPAGSVSLSSSAGASGTPFTITLPGGASCSGDSAHGYAWHTFVTSSFVDASTLTFTTTGPAPVYGAYVEPMSDDTGAAVLNRGPAPTGQITGIPTISLGFLSPTPASGNYTIGLACTRLGAVEGGHYWATQIVVTTNPLGGFTWSEVVTSTTTTSTTSSSGATTTTAGGASTTSTTTTGGATTTTVGGASTTTTTIVGPPCASVSTSGVLAWWHGNDAPQDTSGATNTFVVDSGTISYGPGRSGDGFTFTGGPGLADYSMHATVDALTLEGWVKPVRNIGTVQSLMSRWKTIGSKSAVDLDHSYNLWLAPNDQLVFETKDTSTRVPEELRAPDAVLFDGNFHHVAATWDAHTITLYIDGVQAATKPSQGGRLNDTTGLTSFNLGGGLFPFTGTIDEPTVWSRVLSAQEVAAIAASPVKC
jgi:Concanavalin A-like lectin/glucanases superfamily